MIQKVREHGNGERNPEEKSDSGIRPGSTISI